MANLVVISEEAHFQTLFEIQKKESKVAVPPAFKEQPAKFPDADAAVEVRGSGAFGKLK